MTREEFFNALNSGAKWDVGVSIARTNPLPLDANSVFESEEALSNYVRTNALAYPGQVVVVLGVNEEQHTFVKVAVIESVGASGTTKELAVSSGSNADIDKIIADINKKINGILDGTTAVAKATGDAQGNDIVTTYATKTELAEKEDALKRKDGELSGEITKVKDSIAPVVEAETNRAKEEEGKLNTAIQEEVKRSTDKDDAHDQKISAAEGRLTKLEDQIKGVTGAMHFAGVIEGADLPAVDSYKPGDVIVLKGNSKEYILIEEGTEVKTKKWIELGDESLYATNSKVEALETKLNQEVEKLTAKDTELKGQITTEVQAEAGRADGVEKALGTRIDGVEAKIGTKNDEGTVESVYGAIAKLRKDSEAADTVIRGEFAAADNVIDGKVTALDARVEAVENKAAANETAIGEIKDTIIPTLQAAANEAHAAINTRVSNLEKKDEEHNTTLGDLGGRLSAVEGQLGKSTDEAGKEGSVEARLKQVFIDLEAAGKIDHIAINGEDLVIDQKRVNIPVASADKLGVVKSVAADNKITIAEDGTMEVHKLNVNKLVQTGDTILILDGGNASGHATK